MPSYKTERNYRIKYIKSILSIALKFIYFVKSTCMKTIRIIYSSTLTIKITFNIYFE